VVNLDIVIVSYNLLQNKNYVAFPHDPKTFGMQKKRKSELEKVGVEYEPSVAVLTAYKRMMSMEKSLEKLKDKEPKSIKGVILDHFHWHRVVMDEGHELIDDKTVNGNSAKTLFYCAPSDYSVQISCSPNLEKRMPGT
jgi:SNF2 family DNA or RNA helicase